MANRVGGEFFGDFADVAKTAATPQEIHEVVGNLDQILNLLETADNVGDVPETDAALRGELDGIYTRISRMKNQLLKGTYGRAAAAKLKPVVAAMLERVTKAYGKDKAAPRGDDAYRGLPCPGPEICWGCDECQPGSDVQYEMQEMTAAIDRSQQEWPEGTAYEIPGEIPVEAAIDRSQQEWPDDEVYELPTEEPNQPHGVLPEAESLRQFPERPKQSYTDGEFSDIGGTSADLSKAVKKGAATPEIGDEVRARVGGNYFSGTLESIEGDKAVIVNTKGLKKTVPLADVSSMEDVAQHNIDVKKRDTQEHTQETEEQQRERIEKLTQADPTGTYDQLADYLVSTGYKLKLDISDEQFEDFESQYYDITGEQLNAKSRSKSEKHAYKGGWTVEFPDTPEVRALMPWPIDVEKTGLTPRTGEGNERAVTNGKTIKVRYNRPAWELIKRGLRYSPKDDIQEVRTSSMNTKNACGDNCAECDEEVVMPTAVVLPGESQGANSLPPAETAMPETEKEAGFNFFFPGQVLKEFYPGLQHEVVDYPNENNSPMIEDIDLDAAMNTPILAAVSRTGYDERDYQQKGRDEEGSLMCAHGNRVGQDKCSRCGGIAKEGAGSNYVSTSPAAAAGIGRDGKPQVLDGAPLRKENDIRGGMFMDEFHQQYTGVPGALLSLASAKIAAGDEKKQFGKFLKLVMGEIAATMVAAFKVTSRPILNQVPGIGEVQLAQVEQPSSLSSFNIVNTGSRVKKLLDKLNDSDIKEAINDARAQAAVWLDDPNGGYVYEVFARAESIDTDSMIMKYTFVTGTKESE
jgi:hypothetical protein